MLRALILSDNQDDIKTAVKIFRKQKFSVRMESDIHEARSALLADTPDVVLVNIDLHGKPELGFELFDGLDVSGVTDIFLTTKAPSVSSAVKGMRLGASDYFIQPLDTVLLEKRLKGFHDDMACENNGEVHKSGRGLLVGESNVMQRLYRLIRKVAPTNATVLLAGETGVGKELVAQTIYELSEQAEGEFIAVNCGAISPELMESELFGHVKGAFTGAHKHHKGFFQRAQGGVLFLDEVTEMPIDLQVKLLRALEEQVVSPVGSEDVLSINARIIASTNRDPNEAIQENKLREDLYYRLAQFPVYIPPLQEREQDVELLAKYFLSKLIEENGATKSFSQEAIDMLISYDWPGNVRELKNAITRAFIISGGIICPEDLPGEIPSSKTDKRRYMRVPVGSSLDDVERRMIRATIDHCDNDKTQAAKMLGISKKTLYNRMKKYELQY